MPMCLEATHLNAANAAQGLSSEPKNFSKQVSKHETLSSESNGAKITSPKDSKKICTPQASVLDYALSLLWLSLCSVLVYKHNDLVLVFLAFVSSFAIAALLSFWSGDMRDKKHRFHKNSSTKTKVGLIACSFAFWLLSQAKERVSTFTSNSADYCALSIAAGYLAFDHWFSAIYKCQPPPGLWSTGEDALTLTVILVSLVQMLQQQQQQSPSLLDEILLSERKVHATICAWVAYKIVRLALQLQTQPAPVAGSPAVASASVDQSKTAAKIEKCSKQYVWRLYGNTYDLTDYVANHPGGKEAILLAANREDCTPLFQSYHPFNIRQARQVLEKYRINDEVSPSKATMKPTLLSHENDPFYDEICKRVAETLRNEHKMDPIKNRAASKVRTAYYLLILSALAASGYAHCKGNLLGSFFFAFFGWFIGSLGHDAGHFAASRVALLNDIGVWGMTLLCNPMMWQHQHTYAHHSHTNSFEHDPDLHHFEKLLRVHRRFKQGSIYKNQSNVFYVFFAYAFVVFGTCFWIPLGMLQEGSLYGMVEWTDRKRPLRAAGMFLHFVGYVGVIMILPFFVHRNWWSAAAAVILHVATSGMMFAVFSQINHLNERSIEHDVAKDSKSLSRHLNVKNSWAAQQVETSNNFCPDSLLWHLLSNGLNLQIEHHLFPSLNHGHLSLIQPTVQKVCKEYGVCYKSYNSWSDLMQATLDWLETLSTGD